MAGSSGLISEARSRPHSHKILAWKWQIREESGHGLTIFSCTFRQDRGTHASDQYKPSDNEYSSAFAGYVTCDTTACEKMAPYFECRQTASARIVGRRQQLRSQYFLIRLWCRCKSGLAYAFRSSSAADHRRILEWRKIAKTTFQAKVCSGTASTKCRWTGRMLAPARRSAGPGSTIRTWVPSSVRFWRIVS